MLAAEPVALAGPVARVGRRVVVEMVAVGRVVAVARVGARVGRADNVPLGHSQNSRSHTRKQQPQNLARRLDIHH